MTRTAIFLTASALAALLLGGCATPASERYYRLAYPLNGAAGTGTGASADAPAAIRYELVVGSVQIPEAINRAQLVVQKSDTEALISDDQRWVAPLDEQIGQAVLAGLRSRLPGAWLASSSTVSAVPAPGMPRYHLKVQVEQLLIQSGDKVTLEAGWVVQDGSRKLLKRERTVIVVPLRGPGYDPVAPAVSEAVQQLCAALAKSVQAAGAS
ncbi:membrane integrity-associated transporter subunit PqiC [Undibacterium sp.]|uniref:PqiC family protein n=1 Tax=Undibacterium sp. TaxID=1914977 RepID=UPI00374D0B0D